VIIVTWSTVVSPKDKVDLPRSWACVPDLSSCGPPPPWAYVA
jgi:hypothetical protein